MVLVRNSLRAWIGRPKLHRVTGRITLVVLRGAAQPIASVCKTGGEQDGIPMKTRNSLTAPV